MNKLIIVDDETAAREYIGGIVKANFPEIEISGYAFNVESAKKLIEANNPDIVLLDINLPDGTGFDLLNRLKNHDFRLIIISAEDNHALRAIKHSAIDYIVKPFEEEELIKSLGKILAAPENILRNNLSILKYNLNNSLGEQRILLKNSENIYLVRVNDIMRCEADGHYTFFYLANGNKILVSRILKEFDEILENSGFFRSHMSHLVNLKYFSHFKRANGGFIVMKDNSEVPVASRRKDILFELLEKLT